MKRRWTSHGLGYAAVLTALVGLGYHQRVVRWYGRTSIAPTLDFPSIVTTSPTLTHGTDPTRHTFYLLPVPELTTWLVGNFTSEAVHFYNHTINEERAEIWLHRGFERLQHHHGRTEDPDEAHVVIIPAYLHFNAFLLRNLGIADEATHRGRRQRPVEQHDTERKPNSLPWTASLWGPEIIRRVRLHNVSKPHVLAVPTWNPKVSRKIGLPTLVHSLTRNEVNLYALGLERNSFWYHLPTTRILPVPYVVATADHAIATASPALSMTPRTPSTATTPSTRIIFFAGDARPNAGFWSGCHRAQLLLPLVNVTLSTTAATYHMDVRVSSKTLPQRLSQAAYNDRIRTATFCLILCGDTPTSRSLASAMSRGGDPKRDEKDDRNGSIDSGCVPLRIGSRWRGICDAPCREGWGWNVANRSHLPFGGTILDWSVLPELDEAAFATDPVGTIHTFLSTTSEAQIAVWQQRIRRHGQAWMYGYGHPVTSNDFGRAVEYVWRSLADALPRVDAYGLAE